MIHKNELAILEFDDVYDSVIMPTHEKLDLTLPRKCVYGFLADHIDQYALKIKAKKVAEFESATKIYPIYTINHKGFDLVLVQAPVGAAPAAQLMDWLIGYGVREIISTGTCGCLVDIAEGTFLVPTRALRQEGTSFHYVRPSRYIDINSVAISAIEDLFKKRGLKYSEVMTWTTDGFYRETKDLVKYRVEEGCSVVEMECSALASVAEMRKAIWGEILFTADTLADIENYDQRNWAKDSFAYALELAMDAVILIQNYK